MIIKTDIPKRVRKQLDKCLDELYHLEDLTDYENYEIGRIIDKLQNCVIRYNVLPKKIKIPFFTKKWKIKK